MSLLPNGRAHAPAKSVRRPQVRAAEKVHVQVKDTLAPLTPHIQRQTVAVGDA